MVKGILAALQNQQVEENIISRGCGGQFMEQFICKPHGTGNISAGKLRVNLEHIYTALSPDFEGQSARIRPISRFIIHSGRPLFSSLNNSVSAISCLNNSFYRRTTYRPLFPYSMCFFGNSQTTNE